MISTPLPIFTAADLRGMGIPCEELIDETLRALADVARPENQCPTKLRVDGPDTVSYAMLARNSRLRTVAFKSSFTKWHTQEHTGDKEYATSLLLFDEATGAPIALMDGGRVGALRTAATAVGLAAKAARPQTATALVIGTGTQAQQILHLLPSRFPDLRQVTVTGSHPVGRAECAAILSAQGTPYRMTSHTELRDIAGGADLIFGTAGPHVDRFVEDDDTSPGSTALIVGYGIGASCLWKADRLLTTSSAQMAVTATDYMDNEGNPPTAVAEIPDLLLQDAPLRATADEKVVIYSSGLVMTDLAVGRLLVTAAPATKTESAAIALWR